MTSESTLATVEINIPAKPDLRGMAPILNQAHTNHVTHVGNGSNDYECVGPPGRDANIKSTARCVGVPSSLVKYGEDPTSVIDDFGSATQPIRLAKSGSDATIQRFFMSLPPNASRIHATTKANLRPCSGTRFGFFQQGMENPAGCLLAEDRLSPGRHDPVLAAGSLSAARLPDTSPPTPGVMP